jgi:signal transduction histidine kinase
MPTLIAYSAKLAPRTRSSLLHRYAMDYIRLNEHSAAEALLKRGKEEAERAAQAEREARSKAEAANRSKSEFLANMSHELRTPLNAIIGFSEMMKDGVMGPLQNQVYEGYSQDIHRSARHLLEVINDVLDLSKIEFGKADLQEGDVDLDEAIRGCVRLIDERATRGQVSVEYKPAVAPPLLRADGRRIRQILINLLSNAVKFTPPSGRVSIHVIASEGGGVVVAVVDTGIGIKAADMEKVMAPFGQGDTSLERKYEGTGLGLPLCKAFAEMHDGRLFLESTPGSGTAACLFLPSVRVRWKAVAA